VTTELYILLLSILLGIIHIIVASHLISTQYGYRWTAGNREEEVPPLKGVAGRVDRAVMNFLETFPFFAVSVIVAHILGIHTPLTIWGVQLYFWGRVAYAILYAIGIPLARSMAWNVAIVGIFLILVACFKGT
jgi:uncharacterized MAPEG superfamily protein